MSWTAALWWLGTAAAADPVPLELEADEVVIEEEGGQAQGQVRVTWERWRLRAERLEWTHGGDFRAEQLWLSPCDCDQPPWALRARQADGTFEENAILRGGALEICGKALLPIPFAVVPLRERRNGLRLPRLGHGQDGWIVAQPVFLGLGQSTDLTLTPEWRSQRALRVLGESTVRTGIGPDARVGGAIGQEQRGAEPRGMWDADMAGGLGRSRAAVDATWLTDPRYLSDYGSDYLGRAAPWTESLLVAGVGPLRLESDTFGATDADVDALAQRPIAGVLSMAGQPIGPLSASAGARVDMVDTGLLGSRAVTERISAALAVHGSRWLGPVQIESRAEGRTVQWTGAQPWHEGRVWSAARVALWGDAGGLRHLADLGVAGSVARGIGTPILRLPTDTPAPDWALGPSLRSRWLSSAGVPVALEVALPWTDEGLQPTGSGRAQLGAWGSRVAGSPSLQEASTWWDDGRLHAGLGAARFHTLLQARGETAWTLPAPVDAWRPGWRGLQDLRTGQLLSQGPTLGYDSPCDCLSVEAGAAWTADRDLPEFHVRLDLR